MDKRVVVRRRLPGPASGGELLDELRRTVKLLHRRHPELTEYELYDVGLCPGKRVVDVSFYFKPKREAVLH